MTRVRRGRGFAYRTLDGRPVRDPATLAHIRALAIPPAWEDVWIASDERSHLQAAGTDAAGRRQYRYHPEWQARRATQKFSRVEAFASTLPALRDRVARDLRRDGLPRERVLACAVRLLDEASFRVGGETYAERNGSFGLATLRRSHVRLEQDRATFDYSAKSGTRRIQVVRDPQALEVLRLLCERRGGGRELLAYREGDRWRDVRSSDINDYLKDHLVEPATAKDFRTWQATVLAAVKVAEEPPPDGAASLRRLGARVVREVADQLGNTPAVCRASYIDPRVFERLEEGVTIAGRLAVLPRGRGRWSRARREAVEAAVLDLLAGALPRMDEAA